MHSPDRRCSPCTTAASEGWRTWRCSRTSMMAPSCTTSSCVTSRDTSMWVSHKLCHTWWPNEALCDPKPEWKCHTWNLPFVHVKINQFEFNVLHMWTNILHILDIFTSDFLFSRVNENFHVNFTFAHVNGFYSHVEIRIMAHEIMWIAHFHTFSRKDFYLFFILHTWTKNEMKWISSTT